MRRLRDIVTRLILPGCLLLTLAAPCLSAEIKNVHFDEQAVINDIVLELRGVAVLKWAMLFNVYAGGFYLPENVAGSQWASDVPKKLELSYFREIKARDFGDASDKLLRENLDASAYQALAERLQIFYDFFENVSPGDRYSLIYSPELGTELRLNDQTLGRVSGHDFAIAYFGIWLGEKPINKTFRDRLLDGRQN